MVGGKAEKVRKASCDFLFNMFIRNFRRDHHNIRDLHK